MKAWKRISTLVLLTLLSFIKNLAEGVKLNPNVLNLRVVENEILRIDCYEKVSDKSVANLTWTGPSDANYKVESGQKPNPDDTVTFHQELVFWAFTEKDAGKYTCTYQFEPNRNEYTEITLHFQKKCEYGKHGEDCTQDCNMHCKIKTQPAESPCFILNGTCKFGCVDGYTGSFCDEGCVAGKYGSNCEKHCSKNCMPSKTKYESSCDPVDGNCVHGCIAGYQGTYCNTALPRSSSTLSDADIAGIVVGLLLLLLGVVVAIIIYLARRHPEAFRQRCPRLECLTPKKAEREIPLGEIRDHGQDGAGQPPQSTDPLLQRGEQGGDLNTVSASNTRMNNRQNATGENEIDGAGYQGDSKRPAQNADLVHNEAKDEQQAGRHDIGDSSKTKGDNVRNSRDGDKNETESQRNLDETRVKCPAGNAEHENSQAEGGPRAGLDIVEGTDVRGNSSQRSADSPSRSRDNSLSRNRGTRSSQKRRAAILERQQSVVEDVYVQYEQVIDDETSQREYYQKLILKLEREKQELAGKAAAYDATKQHLDDVKEDKQRFQRELDEAKRKLEDKDANIAALQKEQNEMKAQIEEQKMLLEQYNQSQYKDSKEKYDPSKRVQQSGASELNIRMTIPSQETDTLLQGQALDRTESQEEATRLDEAAGGYDPDTPLEVFSTKDGKKLD